MPRTMVITQPIESFPGHDGTGNESGDEANDQHPNESHESLPRL